MLYLRQGYGTNQLNYIRDQVNGSTAHKSNYTTDWEDQALNNYGYDEIGNLVKDGINLSNIKWSVYGKILHMDVRPVVIGDATSIDQFYDPQGNRIGKSTGHYQTPPSYLWYVRDAQGNVLAVYQIQNNPDFSAGPLKLIEQDIYGSSRLGVIQRNMDADQPRVAAVNANLIGNTYTYSMQRGVRNYELSNHLGNVLTTITDQRKGVDTTGDGIIDYYLPVVVSSQDYYPFGMQMPGRTFSSPSYRYGFNGKEKDSEVKGEGNQYDYGMRIYDPRAGRFLSTDPLMKNFPWYSPYQYSGNNPVLNVDLDGEEPWNPITKYFLTDAAITAVKDPNSSKAKVYGAVMGVGSSVQKTVVGVYNTVRHPFQTLRGLGNMFTKSPIDNAVDYSVSIAMKYASMGDNSFTNYAITSEILMDILFAVEGSRSIIKPNGAGIKSNSVSQIIKRGAITGEKGVVWAKARAAAAGDLSAAAELRVAKQLRKEGSNVNFIDANAGNAKGTGTFDFTVDGIRTDVKRLEGLGRNAVGYVAKGVEQVGPGGQVIIVRPANSKFTLQQYESSLINNFKPKQPGVTIRVVDEASLPKLGGK